jgi:plasmid stabilization system protein ParE
MALSPTFPSLYKYGFATSRAADLLSKGSPTEIPHEEREVFSACSDLVERILKGREFLFGSNVEVHNLRPEDVEIFTFLLDTDRVTKKLAASSEEEVRRYFQEIYDTFKLLITNPRGVDEAKLGNTREFVNSIADSLIENARESLRRRQAEEPSAAFHD